MMVLCEICHENQFKYKCPNCYAKYCSVKCFKQHKEVPCLKNQPIERYNAVTDKGRRSIDYTDDEDAEDRVPTEALNKLGDDKELKCLLENPHLRKIIKHLDSSTRPEIAMEAAMQEPIFVEFADACLRTVEPSKET